MSCALCIAARNILTIIIFKERVPHSAFPVIFATSEIVSGVGGFIGSYLTGIYLYFLTWILNDVQLGPDMG